MGTTASDHPVDRYFAAVDRGDLAEAAAQFADDVVMVRPAPGAGGGGLAVVRGKAALVALLERRGAIASAHEVLACAVDGDEYWAQGLGGVSGSDTRSVYFVHATLGPDGLITRFISEYLTISQADARDAGLLAP